MNAFEEASELERKAMQELIPFIKKKSFDGRFVVFNNGSLVLEFQKKAGDVIFHSDADRYYTIDFKVEEENKWSNFFIEIYSNKTKDKETPGWYTYGKFDLLGYYFFAEKIIYTMRMDNLRTWGEQNLHRYPLKKQRKRIQANNTWGKCVPIDVLCAAINVKVENVLDFISNKDSPNKLESPRLSGPQPEANNVIPFPEITFDSLLKFINRGQAKRSFERFMIVQRDLQRVWSMLGQTYDFKKLYKRHSKNID